ncbi:uncharacterized protein [Amphiura filiformis]|uniref:uncharacterized protein n=1 Tax=Amphiura filiformis TaxID=82378 RepID=UPI003B214A99
MSSLLPSSSIKHADASKRDKVYHSYDYKIAEEDPGKSLYAQYHEDLESQTKSRAMLRTNNGSSRSNSDGFLPLSSSHSLPASQDNVQMLLMSNTTAPVISDQSSSEPPQSAIFPTQSGYYKSKDGSDSDFDFLSDSKTKAATHDVLTSHDSDTSIWRSIRYVAKELEHDKSYASYRRKEDTQNETKVKSADAKTKSAKSHHSSSISSSALPSSTTCRTSPQGKGSTFSNFKLNSSSSRQISSTSHPNLSIMSSTRKFTNGNISGDQSSGWMASNVDDGSQFIARQGHSSSNVLEHQRKASIGKTSPLRYSLDVDTGSRVQRSQGKGQKTSPSNVTHKTLSQSAMVPEGYLGQRSTVRHKWSSVSSERLTQAESRVSEDAAASQMHGSKTLLQSSYRNRRNTSDIPNSTSQHHNTAADTQGKSMQNDFDTSLKYNDLLDINTSVNSSGTFLLEDLQSTVSDVSAREPTYKTNSRVNQPYVAKTRSEQHGLRSMTAADSHRLSSFNGVGTQRNGIEQVVHTRKTRQQSQQLRKPVQSSQMRANKGLKHLSQKMHQQKLSPERRTAQDVNLSNSSLSSLSPNGKSPRRTTSILWAFKLLDLLHSAPLDRQEELVTKAYWFRRWLVNVRILGAAKREEQDNWNRAVALDNLHLLQKTFTGWHTIIRVNQEAARQMWHQHTLEKGLRSLQWAVSQTKILQNMMEERRHRRDLESHFNKWKNLTTYRRQRFQLLDTIARKYALAKTFTQWKKQHAVEQRKKIAVLHFKVQLLSSAFHQWQKITARSRVKGCQEEMASVHFEVRITKVYWESMKTMYVKTQQAKQHYRHHRLVQVFQAWQQGCLIAKGEHIRDNCQAKEARRRALMRTHLTMWREKLTVLKARKRLDQVKLRYAWEIWQLRYQRQKLHRLILASQERRDIKRRALHRWMVYVHEWREKRKKAETILGRVLLRRIMQRWTECVARQKHQRAHMQNFIHSNQLKMKHHIFQTWLNQCRQANAARLCQRLWSERCVKKAIRKWKLCVHVHRLEVACVEYQTIREQGLVQASFKTWIEATCKERHTHERVESAMCLMQHNQLHRILLSWRLITMEMKSISPMVQRRNHKMMTGVFDAWRDVVRRRRLCSHHQLQLKHRRIMRAFMCWRERSRQAHKYQVAHTLLKEQKLHRHLLAWRQVTRRKSAVQMYQGRCERRLMERTFMVWLDGYEERQLQQEICRADEIQSHLLLRVYFRRWHDNITHQKKLTADLLVNIKDGRRQRTLLTTFNNWQKQTKVAQFTRKMCNLNKQRSLHQSLLAWRTETNASFQQAVHSFSLSLLEVESEETASTASYSFLSSAVVDDELKNLDLESSPDISHSSADETTSVQPMYNVGPPSHLESVRLMYNTTPSSPVETSSNAAYSSIPDSGYLGNIRTSSSPSASSGIFDHQDQALPPQYLSHSGGTRSMLLHGKVYSSTPIRRNDVLNGNTSYIRSSNLELPDNFDSKDGHDGRDIIQVEDDDENLTVLHSRVDTQRQSNGGFTGEQIDDRWMMEEFQELNRHGLDQSHVHPWLAMSHAQDISQRRSTNKRDIVMCVVQRWRLWPASTVFYQWLEYTRKQKTLGALQYQGQYRVAQIQMMFVWKEWKRRLETSKVAENHRDTRQKSMIFRQWRLWTNKQRHETDMKSKATRYSNEKIIRKALTTWKTKLMQRLNEQRIKQEQTQQKEQVKQERENQQEKLRSKFDRNTKREYLKVWRHKAEMIRSAEIHYNRVIALRCLSMWSSWTIERLEQKEKCNIMQMKRSKKLAFNHWRLQLSKVQAADDLYIKSFTHHLKTTLQAWHTWTCKQRQYHEAETVVIKQREKKILQGSWQVWKAEKDKMKEVTDMADNNCVGR